MGKLANLNLRATFSGIPCLDDLIAHDSSRGIEFKGRVVSGLMGANFIKNPACDCLRYLIRGESVRACGALQLELDF